MNTAKSIVINNLTVNNAIANKGNEQVAKTWMNIKGVKSNQQITQIYNHVCQKYQQQNKWILMINPEESSLEELVNQNEFDSSKILRVNISRNDLKISRIKNALSKGNCAAIVLSNTSLKKTDMQLLSDSAKLGKTQCIVLENNLTMH